MKILTRKRALKIAKSAAKFALNKACTHNKNCFLGALRPRTAVILGTGWGDVLREQAVRSGMSYAKIELASLPGFELLKELDGIDGHKRELVIWNNIVMLCGRIHMNEATLNPYVKYLVRLQVETLLQMGVENLILTNAAGSLKPEIKVGDIVAHTGFITLFAPPRPMFPGEFVSAEDCLSEKNAKLIIKCANSVGLAAHMGAGAMVTGPDFEGRQYDKAIMRECGASMAMMSILPEAAVASLYTGQETNRQKVNVYAMSFITNNDSEEHSHEENQKRAHEKAQLLGKMLEDLIFHIS